MKQLYIHPFPIRLWHWINATGVITLLLTGLQVRYVGLVDVVSLKLAVNIHNWVGFLILANFFLWFLYNLLSRHIRVYLPETNPKKYYLDSFKQAKFYGWGIVRGEPNPHHITAQNKFNALQKASYQIIMLIVLPLQIFTGLLLWDVEAFSGVVAFLGGVRVVDSVHVLITIFFVGFLFIHLYLATLGHTATAHIKAMFTGYEDVDDNLKTAGR